MKKTCCGGKFLCLRELRQEDCEFETSLGYISRPCLNNNKVSVKEIQMFWSFPSSPLPRLCAPSALCAPSVCLCALSTHLCAPSTPSVCSLYPVWVLPLLCVFLLLCVLLLLRPHAFLSKGRLASKVSLPPLLCVYFKVFKPFWGCFCPLVT